METNDNHLPFTKKLFSQMLTKDDDKKSLRFQTAKSFHKISQIIQYPISPKPNRHNNHINLSNEIDPSKNKINETLLYTNKLKRKKKKKLNYPFLSSPITKNKSTHTATFFTPSKRAFDTSSNTTTINTPIFHRNTSDDYFRVNLTSLSNIEILSLYQKYISTNQSNNETQSHKTQITSHKTDNNFSPPPKPMETTCIKKSIKRPSTSHVTTHLNDQKKREQQTKKYNIIDISKIDYEYQRFINKENKEKKKQLLFNKINNDQEYNKKYFQLSLKTFLENYAKETRTGNQIIKRDSKGRYEIFKAKLPKTADEILFTFQRQPELSPYYHKSGRKNKLLFDTNNERSKSTKISRSYDKIRNIVYKCKRTIKHSTQNLKKEKRNIDRSTKKTSALFFKQKYHKDLNFIRSIKKDVMNETNLNRLIHMSSK